MPSLRPLVDLRLIMVTHESYFRVAARRGVPQSIDVHVVSKDGPPFRGKFERGIYRCDHAEMRHYTTGRGGCKGTTTQSKHKWIGDWH